MTEGDRPAGAVGGDRPGPAGALLDVGDEMAAAAVHDEVAGLQLVSVDGGHRLASFRASDDRVVRCCVRFLV
jgi:hypothetical protein